MNSKEKYVAIAYDQNDKCVLLSKVKMVNEREYNRLLNEKHENDSKKELEDYQHNENHKGIEHRLVKLEKKDLILAKSIYDNFVDRGLIENDEKFQQAWFDFYFNGCELEFEAPEEFKQIMQKVGNF